MSTCQYCSYFSVVDLLSLFISDTAHSCAVTSTATRNIQALEIRLACQSVTRPNRPTAGRGRPQNGAALLIRVKPPSHLSLTKSTHDKIVLDGIPEDTAPGLEDGGYSFNSEASSISSSTSSSESLLSPRSSSPSHSLRLSQSADPDVDEDDATVVPSSTPTYPQLRKRLKPKRIRGYVIDSEDEVYSTSADEDSDQDKPLKPLRCFSDAERDGDGDNEGTFAYTEIINVSTQTHSQSTTRSFSGWFAPSILPSHALTAASTSATLPEYTENGPSASSLPSQASLPQYADKITSEPETALQDTKEKDEKVEMKCETPTQGEMNIAEKALASFTSYESLKRARLDSEYESAFGRLQTEWCFAGGLVSCLYFNSRLGVYSSSSTM